MILDSKWYFSDGQSMPNGTTAVCTNYIDWTASKWKDWINTSQDLWVIVTCNTVPGAGTSIQVVFYQHTSTSLASGDILLSGRTIAIADLSADPYDEGHLIFAVPLLSCLATVQNADRDRYCGPVLVGTGDVSTGKVDAWLQVGPPVPTYVPRPAIVGASNVVMPT